MERYTDLFVYSNHNLFNYELQKTSRGFKSYGL
jgi:hypothetical protein